MDLVQSDKPNLRKVLKIPTGHEEIYMGRGTVDLLWTWLKKNGAYRTPVGPIHSNLRGKSMLTKVDHCI